jgi:3-phenylpropionate/trans-cinnamate dioxygenase ferredoxin component
MEIDAASTGDIPQGKMKGIQKQDKSILIANVKGNYYAIGNICNHMGCLISDGSLTGNNARCPCHGSTYDVRSGANVTGPATRPEQSFKVRVDGDRIMVEI